MTAGDSMSSEPVAWTNERPFQALALTGGGYRGLFTARVLEVIEAETARPIARSFDLLAGTSIGGVIALAAAFEVPMRKVVSVFENRGELIFPPQNIPTSKPGKLFDLWTHSRRARYNDSPLREAISTLIAPDAFVRDALHPFVIPAVNVTQGAPQVFKTRHRAEWTRDQNYKAIDIALATSAAPTFFPLAEVAGSAYADGGLFANAPDLIALHEAEHFFNVQPNAFRLLSIGTTTNSYSISLAAGRNFGIADWMEQNRLFSVMISAQQQFMGQLLQHKLGDRYVRIDHEPSHEQARDLGLDNAGPSARQTLVALGSKVATDHVTVVKPFLSHQPQLRIVDG